MLVLFSQNRPASLLPHLGAILWYPAGQHVLFPDLSFRKKKSRDNLPVNFQYRAVLYKHTCNTRMKGRRTRRHCQGQLFFRVLTWPKGDQGIIFQIVASVRDPSCIKGLNLAGMAPKESFCQATPPPGIGRCYRPQLGVLKKKPTAPGVPKRSPTQVLLLTQYWA